MALNKNAKKWVAALRSGKYKQGKGALHKVSKSRHHTFCCLGVACEIYRKENEIKVVKYGSHIIYNEKAGVLPQEVTDWLGLDNNGGYYSKSSLMSHNDEDRLSFEEIADIIESQPKGLFK